MGCLLSKFQHKWTPTPTTTQQDESEAISTNPKKVTDNTRKNENLVQQPQIKNLPTQQVTDDLKMGSITEVWKNSGEWKKFTNFLDTSEPEGIDSAGVPMKLSRYAVFLQIYVNLYYKEKELLELHNGQDILTKLIWEIKNHPEGFLDSERCLKCVDAGKRNEVLKNLKMLKQGKISEPGIWIYQPMYSAVLDKLNYLLGHYHALK